MLSGASGGGSFCVTTTGFVSMFAGFIDSVELPIFIDVIVCGMGVAEGEETTIFVGVTVGSVICSVICFCFCVMICC